MSEGKLVPGAGGIFSCGLPQRAETVVLIYFREGISGDRQSLHFLHSHRRLINATLCQLFNFRWQGKSPQVNSIEFVEVMRLCFAFCSTCFKVVFKVHYSMVLKVGFHLEYRLKYTAACCSRESDLRIL